MRHAWPLMVATCLLRMMRVAFPNLVRMPWMLEPGLGAEGRVDVSLIETLLQRFPTFPVRGKDRWRPAPRNAAGLASDTHRQCLRMWLFRLQ